MLGILKALCSAALLAAPIASAIDLSNAAETRFENIIQTDQIKDILPLIDKHTLILWDMDDTLTDSSISLGSGAWRQYIRKKIPEYEKVKGSRWKGVNLHDVLLFHVALRVPVKPVESCLPELIANLQNKGDSLSLVLTGRGKIKWYSSQISNSDQLTLRQLKTAGYHFERTKLPDGFEKINKLFFESGVFFATGQDKGPFLEKEVIQATGFVPEKIIFIDDKMDQVRSVIEKLEGIGIKDFVGVHYTRAEREHKDHDPIVSTIQLSYLLENNIVLSDSEAMKIKASLPPQDPDAFFFNFLDSFDFSKINWDINSATALDSL